MQRRQLLQGDLMSGSQYDCKRRTRAIVRVMNWTEARNSKAVTLSTKWLKSLAKRRLRFNQAKVQSPTRCRGIRTKPSGVSDNARAAFTLQTVRSDNRANRQARGLHRACTGLAGSAGTGCFGASSQCRACTDTVAAQGGEQVHCLPVTIRRLVVLF